MSTCLREQVSLTGPRGRLDGELCYPIETPCAGMLLCNPHPLMGGQMDNNVIATLAETLAGVGAVTLRFDYAGVGDSEGVPTDMAESMAAFWQEGAAPDEPHMLEDAEAALDFLFRQIEAPAIVVGYSFGAYVAQTLAARHARIRGLALICPTFKQHRFTIAAPQHLQRLVIFSDNDFATPESVTRAWLEQCVDQPEARRIVGADHFFKGCESQVADAVSHLISKVHVSVEG